MYLSIQHKYLTFRSPTGQQSLPSRIMWTHRPSFAGLTFYILSKNVLHFDVVM